MAAILARGAVRKREAVVKCIAPPVRRVGAFGRPSAGCVAGPEAVVDAPKAFVDAPKGFGQLLEVSGEFFEAPVKSIGVAGRLLGGLGALAKVFGDVRRSP